MFKHWLLDVWFLLLLTVLTLMAFVAMVELGHVLRDLEGALSAINVWLRSN